MHLIQETTRALLTLGAVCTLLVSAQQTVIADESKTVEWYLDQARPHLHHSCQSAWDMVEQDQDHFIDMVGTISAVSFYNHDFNIERLTALPEEKQTELQREFYEEIGEMCREDNQSLLAGVVDTALTGAIAKIVAEEQQSD
jgi:hypothetical protein